MTRVYVHICGMGVYMYIGGACESESKQANSVAPSRIQHSMGFHLCCRSVQLCFEFNDQIPFDTFPPELAQFRILSLSLSLAVCRVRHAELGKLQSPMKAFGSLQQCEQHVYPSPSLPHLLSFAVSLTVHLSVQLSASLVLRVRVCVCIFNHVLAYLRLSPTLLQARPIWEQRNVPHVLSC